MSLGFALSCRSTAKFLPAQRTHTVSEPTLNPQLLTHLVSIDPELADNRSGCTDSGREWSQESSRGGIRGSDDPLGPGVPPRGSCRPEPSPVLHTAFLRSLPADSSLVEVRCKALRSLDFFLSL